MRFAIEQIPVDLDTPSDERRGRLVVGGFEEHFELAPVPATATDMAPEWRRELGRLLTGTDAVALRTSPAFAYVVHRVGERVFVQQMYVQAAAWGGTFDADGRIVSVPPRATRSESGDAISEWDAPLDAVRRFLDGGPSA